MTNSGFFSSMLLSVAIQESMKSVVPGDGLKLKMNRIKKF